MATDYWERDILNLRPKYRKSAVCKTYDWVVCTWVCMCVSCMTVASSLFMQKKEKSWQQIIQNTAKKKTEKTIANYPHANILAHLEY